MLVAQGLMALKAAQPCKAVGQQTEIQAAVVLEAADIGAAVAALIRLPALVAAAVPAM